MNGVLRELLGSEAVLPPTTREWKLAEIEEQLEFLDPEKRERTSDLLIRYAEIDQQIKRVADGDKSVADREGLQKIVAASQEQRKELGRLLTPEEYEQMDLTTSWTADNLRKAMREFHPTEDGFRLIFREWRAQDEHLRFPRPAQAGDDDQFIARDFQREVLEIMLTRTANFDKIFRHDLRISPSGNPQI